MFPSDILISPAHEMTGVHAKYELVGNFQQTGTRGMVATLAFGAGRSKNGPLAFIESCVRHAVLCLHECPRKIFEGGGTVRFPRLMRVGSFRTASFY
jgi:hypothetical protein